MAVEKQQSYGVNTGSTSILLVFVVLCLTTFAALSMVSANADWKLTKKAAAAAQSYYEADTAGQRRLQEIDKILLANGGDLPAAVTEIGALAEDMTVTMTPQAYQVQYSIPAGTNLQLYVTLELAPSGSPRYTVTGWQLASTAPWEEDETLDLFGEEDFTLLQ